MIVGSVCMSHSPLLDKIRAPEETERAFNDALDRVRDKVAALKPDLVVVFYPDHVNGFFYRLMPSFCVGIEGTSIGDYGSAAGQLTVPVPVAEDLAQFIVNQGVDTAVSYKMAVDHGAVQPLELLSERHEMPPFIPIFVNSAAAPRPTFDRVRALGRAVGRWAAGRPERILVIGSGGLSHDPPVPALATASPQVREQLIEGREMTFQQRFARSNRVLGEGVKMMQGKSELLALDPGWDRGLLDAFLAGDLTKLDHTPDDVLTKTGGRGGHEVRTWFAALACLREAGEYEGTVDYYEPVDAWLTGMGIFSAVPSAAA